MINRPGSPLFHIEHFIEGKYIKYNSNSGYIHLDDTLRATPQVSCICDQIHNYHGAWSTRQLLNSNLNPNSYPNSNPNSNPNPNPNPNSNPNSNTDSNPNSNPYPNPNPNSNPNSNPSSNPDSNSNFKPNPNY